MTIRAHHLNTQFSFLLESSPGFGSEAEQMRERVESAIATRIMTGARLEASQQLRFAFEDADRNGWDGDGSVAMSAQAFGTGSTFLASLPFYVPSPSIAPGGDGSVAMEWDGPRGRWLTAMLDADGTLSMAWNRRGERGHAWTRFDGAIPDELLHQLRRTIDLAGVSGSC